jgi:hypothetical protein
MSIDNDNDDSTGSPNFQGDVNGPIHIGQGDININEIHYGDNKFDVGSGKEYTGDVFRKTFEAFRENPIRIGKGTQKIHTTIDGTVVGNEIYSEDYVTIKGSVCGLQKVELGKNNWVYGSIIGDDVIVGKGLSVGENVFARKLTIQQKSEVRGNIVCDKIIDSTNSQALILSELTVGGAIVLNQNIEVIDNCQIKSVVSTGDVRVTSSQCSLVLIVSNGTVYLPNDFYIPYIQCRNLFTGTNVKITAACVMEYADLGDLNDIGFLYSDYGLKRIGEKVNIWNSTLISKKVQPHLSTIFFLDRHEHSIHTSLGIHFNGEVTIDSQLNTGKLYTNHLNKELLQAIYELTNYRLRI